MIMKRERIIALILALLMMFTLCACGNDAPASTPADKPAADAPADKPAADAPAEEPKDDTVYTFSFASPDGEESLRHIYIEKPFMDYITEKSEGRIQFTYFPSGSLANTGAILDGCKNGVCDFGIDAPTFYPGVYLYNELLGTPGVNIGSTYEEKQANLSAYNEAYVAPELAKDAHVLANFVTLNTYILTNKEINGVAEFAQENLATSANFFPVYAAMGASTSAVNYGESYESLRLGVIDMIQAGYGIINNFRLYEVTNYAYFNPTTVSNSVMFVSNDAYNSLPDDLKAIVDEAGKMIENEFNYGFVDANEAIVGDAVAAGNPDFAWCELPAEVLDTMAASAEQILADKVAELNAAGLDGDGALALLQSFGK